MPENQTFYQQESVFIHPEGMRIGHSSLLDVEIPIPVGRNFNFLLKPVEEPVNWFTSLEITVFLKCFMKRGKCIYIQ